MELQYFEIHDKFSDTF